MLKHDHHRRPEHHGNHGVKRLRSKLLGALLVLGVTASLPNATNAAMPADETEEDDAAQDRTYAERLRRAKEKNDTEEDEAAQDRAYAERLRRAKEKSEAEQAEYSRRRDSELGRQADRTRLQSRISVLERDESMLQGQMRNAETQLLYMRRDPADMSAYSRRSELESRVSYYRSQLNQVIAEKQNALRQLSDLRFR